MVVVGVDGGTTKTIAMVADDQGHILAAVRGGGSNWVEEDVDIPMKVVVDTVCEATHQAGLTGEQISMAVLSLAGADWPEDHVRREIFLRKAGIAQRLRVKNDSFGGLRAGLRQPYGMVIAAGTGINAAVITPDGTEWAFGYYVDCGGSASIAREVFETVLRAESGRAQPTLLTQMMLNHMDYPTVEAMLRDSALRRMDYGKFYSFTPLVFEAALKGDPMAVGILVHQGRELAGYATALARRFNMCDIAFDVVLSGSVFKGVGPLLIDTITQEIHQVAPQARIVRPVFEPAVGSVLLAYDALGIQVTDSIYAQLAKTGPDAKLFDTTNGVRPTPIRNEHNEEEE